MATHKQIKAVSVYALRSIHDYDKNVVAAAVYDIYSKVSMCDDGWGGWFLAVKKTILIYKIRIRIVSLQDRDIGGYKIYEKLVGLAHWNVLASTTFDIKIIFRVN